MIEPSCSLPNALPTTRSIDENSRASCPCRIEDVLRTLDIDSLACMPLLLVPFKEPDVACHMEYRERPVLPIAPGAEKSIVDCALLTDISLVELDAFRLSLEHIVARRRQQIEHANSPRVFATQ